MKLLETLKAEGRIEEARQHGLLQLIEHPQHAELHYEVASLHDIVPALDLMQVKLKQA